MADVTDAIHGLNTADSPEALKPGASPDLRNFLPVGRERGTLTGRKGLQVAGGSPAADPELLVVGSFVDQASGPFDDERIIYYLETASGKLFHWDGNTRTEVLAPGGGSFAFIKEYLVRMAQVGEYVYFAYEDDLYYTTPGSSTSALVQPDFTLSGISTTPGAGAAMTGTYRYVVAAANTSVWTSRTYESPGRFSNLLNLSAGAANVTVSLGSVAGGAVTSTSATHLHVFRSGGTFGDRSYRSVTAVTVGTASITDSNSDFLLNNATIYEGGDTWPCSSAQGLTPGNIQDILWHQNRVWVVFENDIYVSWRFDDDVPKYPFTYEPDPTDEEANRKGFVFTTSDSNRRNIRAVSRRVGEDSPALSSVLLLFQEAQMGEIIGDVPSNWTYKVLATGPEADLVAPLSPINIGGAIYYHSGEGVTRMNAGRIEVLSRAVDNWMRTGPGAISFSATEARVLTYAWIDNRLWVFRPYSGDNAPSLAINRRMFVWDSFTGEWFEQRPAADPLIMGVTSGGTTGTNLAVGGGDPFLFGTDGRIYAYTGTTDRYVTSSTVTVTAAIPMVAGSRRFVEAGGLALVVPTHLRLAYAATSAASISWRLSTGQSGDQTGTYTLPSSSVLVGQEIRGLLATKASGLALTITASATAAFTIGAVNVGYNPFGIRR